MSIWVLTLWLLYEDPSVPAIRIPDLSLAQCQQMAADWQRRVRGWRERTATLHMTSVTRCTATPPFNNNDPANPNLIQSWQDER